LPKIVTIPECETQPHPNQKNKSNCLKPQEKKAKDSKQADSCNHLDSRSKKSSILISPTKTKQPILFICVKKKKQKKNQTTSGTSNIVQKATG
jgi:hypothetical protein